jgi:hypothetical protein
MALTAGESWLASVFAAVVLAFLDPKDPVEAEAVPLGGEASLYSVEESLAVGVQACHWYWTDL